MLRIAGKASFQETWAKIIFLLLPTFGLSYFLLWNANEYYAVILKNEAFEQALFVGAGMLLSALFYHFRFRFLPSFVLLIALFYGIYQGIDKLSFGEFDTFFHEVSFLIFALTFTAGWLIGWGFTQLRYFSVFLSALFLLFCMALLSRQNELFYIFNKHAGVREYALLFGPAVLYCIYIIFTSELIYSYRSYDGSIWWALSKRLIGFVGLAILLLISVLYFQRNAIKETLANFGGGGKKGENSLLHRNKDNTFSLKKSTQLSGSFGNSNQLLFAAHIDNYFPDSKVPNPIYMTAFYYSKFDTATQTFEEDSLMPFNDLFKPNPSVIPLFSVLKDSAVLKGVIQDQLRRTIDVEVYKTALSPTAFVAPSVSFFVQPITVEKDFRKEFKSAYRAKSNISILNSAYFVYNTENPVIRKFQQQRFQVLQQVKNYEGVNPKLMAYFTEMPQGADFEKIRALADSIEKGKNLPIDKILAVRDFFMAKDANGKQVFSYTDNPGIPDIPNASLLKYFLFQSHKGYCAYYAGATLFLLRAMGIPSRITVGFLTEDRSSKNPGWYWFYAHQAHAWVQVYFPGFGWLDFDTTVGNQDAHRSPKPDGTPPLQPPKAYLAVDGVIIKVDTFHKSAVFKTSRFVFHDKEYRLATPDTLHLDLSLSDIKEDSVYIALSKVQVGDSATAVSYAEVFKNLSAPKGISSKQLVHHFPKPAPIDELHIKVHYQKDKQTLTHQKQALTATDWKRVFLEFGGALLFLILFFLLLPWVTYRYFKFRAASAKGIRSSAYWNFRCAGYYLHLVFKPKGEQTYLQYAMLVDEKWQTNFGVFMKGYLKMKYASQKLTEQEEHLLTGFLNPFLKKIKKQIPFKMKLKAFLNPFKSINFWADFRK